MFSPPNEYVAQTQQTNTHTTWRTSIVDPTTNIHHVLLFFFVCMVSHRWTCGYSLHGPWSMVHGQMQERRNIFTFGNERQRTITNNNTQQHQLAEYRGIVQPSLGTMLKLLGTTSITACTKQQQTHDTPQHTTLSFSDNWKDERTSNSFPQGRVVRSVQFCPQHVYMKATLGQARELMRTSDNVVWTRLYFFMILN